MGIYKNSMGYVTTGVACDRAKMACDRKKGTITSVYNYFNEEMLKATQVKNYVLDNLDNAIREGWIKVYYQPIIRSANGRVCDEEALARWIDPNVGFLSPAEFIPVLEDTKQIYKLDLYVLEQVLKKIKTIEERNLHVVPCSINISRSDFEMCDVVEEIRKRVDAAGIEHDRLTIEITESAIATDMEYVIKQVEQLTEMGFAVWMDDYGSGYSSPEILQRIPFNTLKLDMQFMRQFDKTPKNRIIISEIINKGGCVAFAPEALSSTYGTNQPIITGTGHFLKHYNIPVYFAEMRGEYLMNTKVCLDQRIGRTQVTMKLLFTPEDLQRMSDEEVDAKINEVFRNDDYEWGRENNVEWETFGRICERLDDICYKCPKCGAELQMTAEKNYIRCKSCGNGATMDDYYEFHPFTEDCVIPEFPSKWVGGSA